MDYFLILNLQIHSKAVTELCKDVYRKVQKYTGSRINIHIFPMISKKQNFMIWFVYLTWTHFFLFQFFVFTNLRILISLNPKSVDNTKTFRQKHE